MVIPPLLREWTGFAGRDLRWSGSGACERPGHTLVRSGDGSIATASQTGGSSSPGASAGTPTFTCGGSGGSAAGSGSGSGPTAGALGFDHVFVLVEENHSEDEVLAGAPYLASLAASYASAGDYHAVAHPSEPNYLALVAGSTLGVTDDGWHSQDAPTLADRIEAAGRTWKTYSEGQGSDPTVDAYPYASATAMTSMFAP